MAKSHLEELPEGDFYVICRVSQLGLLRLLNNPTVLKEKTLAGPESWAVYDEMLSDPRFRFMGEPPGLEIELRRLTKAFPFNPKLWQDAYLAAFATSANLGLVTFDKGFAKFGGLNFEILANNS